MIRDILFSAGGGGASISKIMFSAYLSYGQAKEYLNQLIERGLVENEFSTDGIRFRTTPKGIQYLSTVDKMSEMLYIDTRRTSNKMFY
jgi:predicted transcriptional regulator